MIEFLSLSRAVFESHEVHPPVWAVGGWGLVGGGLSGCALTSTDVSRHLYTGVDVRSRVSVTMFSFVRSSSPTRTPFPVL